MAAASSGVENDMRKLLLLSTVAALISTGALAQSTVTTTGTCACRKLNPGILVMQPAQDWATKNVPGAIDGARDRCILLQG